MDAPPAAVRSAPVDRSGDKVVTVSRPNRSSTALTVASSPKPSNTETGSVARYSGSVGMMRTW